MAQLLNRLKMKCSLVTVLLCSIFICNRVVKSVASLNNKQQSSPYPSIDYSTSTSVWDGNHEVLITNEDINHELLAKNKITLHNAIIGVVARRIMNNYDETSMRRDLGDFDDLNKIFKGTVISLPDINKVNAGKVGFSYVFFWIKNMKCYDISVENIIINHKAKGAKEYDLSINIENLAISCDLDWRYAYSFFRGEGSAKAKTTKSDADVTLKFKSINFDLHPPSDIEASQCMTAIEIDSLDLNGGIVAAIANLFDGALSNTIEEAINGIACEELKSLGKEMLGDVLDFVYNFLEHYLTDDLPPEESYLYAENNLSVPPELNLLDFSSLGKKSGDWFHTALQLVDDFLGELIPDPDSTTGVDLQINALLRDAVLDNDRALVMEFQDQVIFDGHDMLTKTLIELNRVKVFGLDTIRRFDSLENAGNHTLLNHFSWEHLDVEIDFTLTMKPSTIDGSIIDVGSAEEVVKQMQVTAGINDIDVDFHFLLAVDKDKVGGLELGSITNSSNILPCILDTIYQMEITGFAIDAGEIDIPTLSGFISPGIDKIVSQTASAVFNMYEATLIKAIPNIFQVSLRQSLNGVLTDFFATANRHCPKKEFPSNETFVNFGDLLLNETDAVKVGGSGLSPYGHILRDVMSLVQNSVLKINPYDGMSYLNDLLVAKLTERQSSIPGCLLFSNEVGGKFRLDVEEFAADLELKLSNATIQNIDTIGAPLNLLDPIAPTILNNTLAIGLGSRPLQGSFVFTMGFDDGDAIQLRNVIEVGIDLGAVINTAADLSIIENALMKFPIEDMLNPNCWLGMIPSPTLDSKGIRLPTSDATLALKDLALAISSLQLNVKCISCTSPLIEELAISLSSPDAMNELTDLMNNGMNYITKLLGGTFLQVQIDRILAEAPLKCPHSQYYIKSDSYVEKEFENYVYQRQPSDPSNMLIFVAAVIASLILFICFTVVIIRVIKRRQLSRWITTLSVDEVSNMLEKQLREQHQQNCLNTGTTAMFLSPSIPLVMRISIPLIVLASIAFFMSGHLSLGASVDVDVALMGENFRIKELFAFSMAQSVFDMWDAGAKELAILILIFSGIWPYTKQLTVLILWFSPPKIVSVARRKSLFLWLDTLGKWSFVDIFVLILSLASFRVSIMTPDELSYLPKDFFKLNLLVIPCWGLYSNMIAQFTSQISSHYIIHYHRKIELCFEEEMRERNNQQLDSKEVVPIYNHSFKGSSMEKGKILTVRPIASIVIIVLSLSFLGLIICGCSLPSYSLEQFGLVGLTSSVPYVKHDIFSTIKLLMDQANFTGVMADQVGLSVLSAVLILTVLVIPCFQLILNLVRWFVPLSQKARLRMFVAIEALAAWQYIEVYLFSIIVASWQLGSVSEFLINDYCAGLEDSFAMLQYFGILGTEEAQCFQVSAKLESAMWILVTASIVLILTNHIVSSAAAHQEEDLRLNSDMVDCTERDYNDNIESENDKMGESTLAMKKKTLTLESPRFTDFYICLLRNESLANNMPLSEQN